jgi:hypothetical protein
VANTVRAKFRCTSEVNTRWSATAAANRSYEFQAVYDPAQPDDQRYAKTTPTGKLTIAVDNPAVTFEPGKAYYLDFTPVEGS